MELARMIQYVKAARKGDRDSFGELVALFERPILSMAWQRLGNRTDAEDAAQNIFISAFRSLHNLKEDEKFPGWLFALAGNVLKNEIRGQNRRPDFKSALLPGDLSKVPMEEVPEITTLIRDLPERERLLLTLRFVEGKTCLQIAEILDEPVNTVYSQIHRSIAKLRDILKTKSDHD